MATGFTEQLIRDDGWLFIPSIRFPRTASGQAEAPTARLIFPCFFGRPLGGFLTGVPPWRPDRLSGGLFSPASVRGVGSKADEYDWNIGFSGARPPEDLDSLGAGRPGPSKTDGSRGRSGRRPGFVVRLYYFT